MRRTLASIMATGVAVSVIGTAAAALPATAAAPSTPAAPAATFDGVTGAYYPVTPSRILDTRVPIGVSVPGKMGPESKLGLKVTGSHGVPATGVSAVVISLTATNPTDASYLVAYPGSGAPPTASSLNFPPRFTGANLVTVPVGADGEITIYNSRGATDEVADVVGFYAADDSPSASLGTSGGFMSVALGRLFDSRTDPATDGFFDGDGGVLPVNFSGDLNAHVTALVVNITTVNQTSNGYVRTWNGVDAEPTTSTTNFSPRKQFANTAIVPTAPCGDTLGAGVCPADDDPTMTFVVHTTGGSTSVIVDLLGVMVDGGQSDQDSRFQALPAPTRIVDSRIGQGLPAALGPQQKARVDANSVAGVATTALVGNLLAVGPSAPTFLTTWSTDDTNLPGISSVNPGAHDVVANADIIPLGLGNLFNVYNSAGNAHVVIDVSGTFELPDQSGSTKQGAKASIHRAAAPETFTAGRVTRLP